MIKQFIYTILALLISLMIHNIVLAENINPANLFQKYNVQYIDSGSSTNSNNEELQYVQRLPDQDYKTFAASIARLVLGLVGTLCFISLSVAGIMYIMSAADSDMQSKAKNIIKYSLYGIVVIGLSYSVVYGIARLDFD
ncbi:hypothetical protein A2272_02315 [Candidatus Peregrinibacteria bacterium RIFOXYA12_FULL_33_12]|nr:MAG: hypothetical protein A2272_02315 [Candidatus Peregrinibacteria bacterium RIFOXYA12_FULL_33_12]OGJ46205.1 MAG: hypothetical protein A2263_04945 [Candidatus Peregrinibacteria bacterium RIFOXYA2_FULL_33_21]OGJ51621.1 MAG: hypothetical protein A2307_04115 [Candidatus Peregrinibacteria bacterium RIFOXYB2_FULL_33_20]